jgi:hypothetical protein
MEPYENIMIGNFLYALGLSIGARSRQRKVPASINLLQQTPLDKLLGDALLQYPGVVRLLEFKRSKNKSDKELHKLELLRTAMMPFPHLDPVSRAVHWYIESNDDASADARAVPYLDLAVIDPPRQTTMFSFIDALVEEVVSSGKPPIRDTLIRQYLECVASWPGESGAFSGGLLIVVDEQGRLTYLALDNIRDLCLTHKMLCELRLERKAPFIPERAHEKTLERAGPTLSR